MSRLSRQEELRRHTGEVLDGHAMAGRGRRGDGPPRPGDVFAFAETSEYSVQWAVIECSPEDPRRLLAVAADLNPLVGSADVAVDAAASCGALTLRCRFEVWLDAADFDLELRIGSTGDGAVERARSKRSAIVEGAPVGSALERETDREPEYHDLLEEVREARRAFLDSRRLRAEKGGEVVPLRASSAEPAPRRSVGAGWRMLGSPFGIAASILLVVGLSGGLLWQAFRLDDLERELRLAEAELAKHTRGAGSEDPLVEVPFAWLSPREEHRGGSKTLSVPAAATYAVLILEIQDPEPYPRYRLEIREEATDAEVFVSELSKTGVTEVSVALPRRLLAAGEYGLRLYGLRGAQAVEVEAYALRIELE